MNEVAIYSASVPDRMRYASALSEASLLPDAYRGKPANVLLALEYGSALGIAPMVAIQQVHIIQGRPVASAQLIGALVRKAGHRLRVYGDDRHAVCEITRSDDADFTFRSEWTWDRAVAAKLTSKDTWRQYPGNMLRARAITECARDACPEALAGISYTAEELGDDSLPDDAYPQTSEATLASTSEADHPSTAVASEPDVIDAEIVEDSDAAGGGSDAGETPAASAPRPDHYGSDRGGDLPVDPTSPLWRKMQAQLSERFGKVAETRRSYVTSVVGREIASTKDLTQAEARRLVDALTRDAAEGGAA